MKNTFQPIGLFLLFTFAFLLSSAQHEKYHAPSDSLVQKKLTQWQDLKFGLMMHWGTYSQWGIVESWTLCPEDEGWTVRRGPHSKSYSEYVKAYENLQTTFNPVKFDPAKWATAVKDAGMKYVVFTTKHHDGFSMFDTKETDYKISGAKSPFASNPKSNVAKEIFTSFRNQGFWTGAYFSKPDWHHENYWWPYFPPKDRNVNYEPTKYPEKWNAYKQFTFNQLKELMSEYGSMDILWLDGGWVRPLSTVDTSVEWQRGIKQNQDIDMPKIAAMARSYQPGILIVDRTVTGEYENYTTPEQQVPDKPLPFPWETCMTMGGSWSYVPGDHYKSTNELIHLLIKIVSRGGNFLLNIGPGPDGEWDPEAYKRLAEIGGWMKGNDQGIYASRPMAPYSDGNIYYTQHKDGKSWYAYYLTDSAQQQLPGEIILKDMAVPKGSKISLPAINSPLKWKLINGNTVLTIPDAILKKLDTRFAILFKVQLP